jgi:hypothetical protein
MKAQEFHHITNENEETKLIAVVETSYGTFEKKAFRSYDEMHTAIDWTKNHFIFRGNATERYIWRSIMRSDRRTSLSVIYYLLKRTFSSTYISNAPGSKLLSIVDFLYSSKTVEQTFKPIIADWRYEYFEALKQRRKWKARCISMRYRFSFINAMTLSKVFSLLKQVRSAIN